MALPDNLEPLSPSRHEWPDDVPLDVQECRTALWLFAGNITKAAERLGVTSLRLRTFVRKSELLSREIDEARQQIVDQAEHKIREAVHSDDASRSDSMARWIAGSQGKSRGWGQGAPSISAQGNVNILVQWAGGADNPMNLLADLSQKAESAKDE
jgi:hypothetical protein